VLSVTNGLLETMCASAAIHRGWSVIDQGTAPGGPLVRARMIAATVGCVGTPTEPTSTDAVAIVTGGSRGAGREIARELASRGYAVIVVYLRDQGEAEAALDEIFAANGTALTVRADVTDELDVERLFDETKAAFGGVDVVVHAAMRGAPVVNREAARQLRRGGAIVTVARSEAITPDLAHELRARDITVNGLAPGDEPPGADHDVADLLALLGQWEAAPGMPWSLFRERSVTITAELEHWLQGDGEKTVASLIELFEEKSFAILFVVLLGVPALPLPTGGVTHVFEIIAILLAAQLIAGRNHIWLPKRWRSLELAGDRQQRFIAGLMRLIRRLERISRPRLRFLFDHRLSNIVFGVLVIAGSLGAFLAPPFSGLDTLPALGVVLLSLGVLLEDFAIVSVALVVGVAGVALDIVLGSVAVRGIEHLF
jgi:3-oxoacyl-[acyl-carrier protein] reductase